MNIPIRTTQCYQNPNHFRSIVSDMNWVCEDAWVPAMSQVCNLSLFQTNSLCLQSIFFLGAVPGMLFFGWFWWVFIKSMWRKIRFHFFSDHYGRLPTIIIANLIALVTGVATPFVTERISFFVLRFKAPANFKLLSYLLELVSGFSWDSLSTLSSPCPTHWVRIFSKFSDISIHTCVKQHWSAVEYVGKTKRTLVGNLGLAICLTLSGCYQPWLAK